MSPERYMEFLRSTVEESAAATYTETVIHCPVSENEQLAMLIHSIEWWIESPETIDTKESSLQAHLAMASKTAIARLKDRDVLSIITSTHQAGFVEGTLTEFVRTWVRRQWILYFNPPILYPRRVLYLAVAGTENVAAYEADVRIGYTLARVSREAFIAALVS